VAIFNPRQKKKLGKFGEEIVGDSARYLDSYDRGIRAKFTPGREEGNRKTKDPLRSQGSTKPIARSNNQGGRLVSEREPAALENSGFCL